MMQLKLWQWIVLALPIAIIVGFFIGVTGWQIHVWGLNWIWAIVVVLLAGWRWLLVKWTSPATRQMETLLREVRQDLDDGAEAIAQSEAEPVTLQQIEAVLRDSLEASRNDAPLWEDWGKFFERCRTLVADVANVYNPEVKYPLLNIYVPQAYGLIRGTVDDVDRWMQKLSPVLNQVSVGQAYQAYEVYQKFEPSARKLWKVWGWAQWAINPAAAAAKTASRSSNNRATEQLLGNLDQMLREAALQNLCRQAIALYSGTLPDSIGDMTDSAPTAEQPSLDTAKTRTLKEILEKAEPTDQVAQKPLHIMLVGRTGAGKSSLINTLFQADRAEVNVLPSTDQIKTYRWSTPTGDRLDLLDTPGYEQVNRDDFRDLVLDQARNADLLLLVTPALDPALQMDVDFLNDLRQEVQDLPAIAIVTQVDRLRPMREWSPPYDWKGGDRPKEISIREATQYRITQLGAYCDRVVPLVTAEQGSGRSAWNADALSVVLVDSIDPAKELRLGRFLRDRQGRAAAAARIIDRYTFQMSTTQGLTALLKSPVLRFLSTLTTGSPTLAYLLAEQIPVEQLPVVIGKLQMAYDLFSLLSESTEIRNFDLMSLWPLLLDNPSTPDRNAWAFGHALVEYWSQGLTVKQLESRFHEYLEHREQAVRNE
ncbi:MAG: GTPase [Elainellaceae cyanobacterium]